MSETCIVIVVVGAVVVPVNCLGAAACFSVAPKSFHGS